MLQCTKDRLDPRPATGCWEALERTRRCAASLKPGPIFEALGGLTRPMRGILDGLGDIRFGLDARPWGLFDRERPTRPIARRRVCEVVIRVIRRA